MKKPPEALLKRWESIDLKKQREHFLSNTSPFGLVDGHQDFRGFSVYSHFIVMGRGKEGIEHKQWRQADFSYSDWNNVWTRSCTFHDVIFDHAIMFWFHDEKNTFERCRFIQTDLRRSGIGRGTTWYRSCTFLNPSFTQAIFKNPVFEDCAFEKCRWGTVDFAAAGLWRCRLSGTFGTLCFRGEYPLPLEQDTKPVKVGLHDVDFSEAQMTWLELTNHCPVERLTLPTDQSILLIPANVMDRVEREIERRWPDPTIRETLHRFFGWQKTNVYKKKEPFMAYSISAPYAFLDDQPLKDAFTDFLKPFAINP